MKGNHIITIASDMEPLILIYRKNNKNKTWISSISGVRKEDSGNSTCLVINASGENGSKTVEVEVGGEM